MRNNQPVPLEAPADAAAFQALTHCSDAQLEALTDYRERLADWSTRFNLVGPGALDVFWSRHAYDSWQLLAAAPNASRWADLGSGAGLPGLVVAIGLKSTSAAMVHLVESQAKRCRFLAHVTAALDLPAQVHNARAESFSVPVEVVTARACAPLTRLLGFAQPWLAQGAVGLFLKGEAVEAEVAEAKRTWSFDVDLRPSASDPRGRLLRIGRLAHRGG